MCVGAHEVSLENWDEIRTAYHVARLGTVSGAADVLGVHHATVIRHIDALERRLGAKLFQRHARGYTPTEAGRDLLQVAQTTDDQFAQLAGRIRGSGQTVSGELVVTSLAIVSSLLTPPIVSFRDKYPDLVVRFLTDERIFRLEYGEAHVAIRAGAVPNEPDNVVQPFVRIRHALYATRDYVERRGKPATVSELANHDLIGEDGGQSQAPFLRWLRQNVPAEAVTWRTSDIASMHEAVRSGAGIGFLPVYAAERDDNMVQVMAPLDDWSSSLWLVTHVDLHRTTKVQAFLSHLKAAAADWTGI